MDRKNFIATLLPLTAISHVPSMAASFGAMALPVTKKIPPYLVKGDTIGITCPAGYITAEEIEPAVNTLKEWGYAVQIGNTVGKKDFTFGGTDTERKNDLQQLLDDKNIKAILFARGGYGAVRIIDAINFKKFIEHPKWLIGFSDITTLHSHIHQNYGIATLHAKMCNSFIKDWSLAEPAQIVSIQSIQQCISGTFMQYSTPYNSSNTLGTATGILVGGNLKTIESLSGSKSDINTHGKILFVEDTGEYLYSIDRMFWNLKRSGKLDHLAGLIVGGFKIKKEETETEAFGKTVEQIVLEKISNCNYPVCFDFAVGHQKNNMALKCGVKHQLTVTANNSILKEIV